MEKILLFIPCYNCEKQIKKVLERVNIPQVLRHITEVILIDNGSTDKTQKVIKEYLIDDKTFPALLVQNKENYSLGGSHKVAFNYAKENGFDYVIVIHGDNQGSIDDIIPILENDTHEKYDCCLGARFKNGSKLIGYSKFRTFGNICFNILFSIILKKKIFDLGAGLNIYNVNMLKTLSVEQNGLPFYFKFPDSLSFNYCMVMALDYYKQSFMFFPLTWKEEDQISNVKLMSQTANLFKMIFLYAIYPKNFITSELRVKKIEKYEYKICQ